MLIEIEISNVINWVIYHLYFIRCSGLTFVSRHLMECNYKVTLLISMFTQLDIILIDYWLSLFMLLVLDALGYCSWQLYSLGIHQRQRTWVETGGFTFLPLSWRNITVYASGHFPPPTPFPEKLIIAYPWYYCSCLLLAGHCLASVVDVASLQLPRLSGRHYYQPLHNPLPPGPLVYRFGAALLFFVFPFNRFFVFLLEKK